MKVWRVERDNGGGPYTCDDTNDIFRLGRALGRAHGWDDETGAHPSPWDDELVPPDAFESRERNCGFASFESCEAWFDGWWERLAEHGYAVSVYDAPMPLIGFGRFQVVFDREQSVRLSRNTITDLGLV